MLSNLDEAKADHLARAVALGEKGAEAAHLPDLAAFLDRYYRHVDVEDLLNRDPSDVLGAAVSHRRLASDRPVGSAKVRAHTPTVEDHGWTSGHTVVEVVTDDMPFLVDSVSSALHQEGLSIHLIVHPQFDASRSLSGELVGLVWDSAAESDGSTTIGSESWMHFEVDRVSDPTVLHLLEQRIVDVLRDVREAVEDWEKMREAALRIADSMVSDPPPLPEAEVAEAWELLRWLVDDHFTFLGYREYTLETRDGEEALATVPGSGLGLLRPDRLESASFRKLPQEVRARARERQLLVLTKANRRSTVHRPAYLDYVGIKTFDDDGNVVGERRFIGLLTAGAYSESVQRIPVLRRRCKAVLEMAGFPATGHSGKDLMQILETYPRDELFQMTADELLPVVLAVMHLAERRQVRLFLRKDRYGRFMSAMVYLPRDRYTTKVRLAMEAILLEAFDGQSADYTARVSESVLARLHYVIHARPDEPMASVDLEVLEQRLAQATRSWDDDFAEALLEQLGEEQAVPLHRSYGRAFPEAYKEDFPPRAAVADVKRLAGLTADGAMGMNLYEPPNAEVGERRFKIYRRGAPMSLAEVLPVLQRMGVEVTDERPYEIEPPDGGRLWLYDFGLRHSAAGAGTPAELPTEELKQLFQDTFAAAWEGRTESDGLNALVMLAGLSWRQAAVLRAYTKYLRQAGTTFSQEYIESALASNLGLARRLVELFETRFDPNHPGDREADMGAIVQSVLTGLDAVRSLDQDRIIRSLLTLIRATLRTNYYQRDGDGQPKPVMSFKFDPTQIPDLPAPRPRFEIWVYSPRVEGVHLRFGSVARGGLRWSDRREDFRTEILGLVKAQAVKNAVIVPVGAKGGFLPKRLPDPAAGRDPWLAEGVAAYKWFISALLDVTDNLVDGIVVPPPAVVRHDSDDPYLVVAADKGTATFSDVANGIAKEYGFWLGDAFASGGSAGYDHKAMGITARGAWESVKRHFRDVDLDTQAQDFTAVGIGDMSGDVFGNGMLLSEHIRLVAAFDHRHVFLDPNPDASTAFAERKRLFELPRSSWEDYDVSLLSEGGGVYPRSAKSIPITDQVREALGLPDDVTQLTPQEVMRAVLRAPVDLFWNGGIGTYVKSESESHSQVGDKANDSIRINGSELRCRVVGEGGNLGFTQLGRVEAAVAGVRINTDAIDNSAGVDTSDHEVNIKILLDAVVRGGDLTEKQRNQVLAEMTDEVAHHVLRDNYEQNILLGNARAQSHSMLSVHKRMVRDLEGRGELDRALEYLPSDSEIDRRDSAGGGLESPELSVLVAYSKMTLAQELLASSVPDEPYFRRVLSRYFPTQIVDRFAGQLEAHPLRREIITTVVVNDMINRGGITFAFRASEEAGASSAEIARAYTVVREIFDLPAFIAKVEELDNKISTQVQSWLFLETRRLLDRATRWILQNRRSMVDVEREIEHFAEVKRLTPLIPVMLQGTEQERLHRRAAQYTEHGVPDDMALATAAHLDAFSLLDIVELANATGQDAEEIGYVYFAISDRFEVDKMLTRITALPRDERWHSLARMALRYDLYGALAGLTANVLTLTEPGRSPEERIVDWENANAEGLARARNTLHEIATGESFDLATISVALRVIRTLVSSASSSASANSFGRDAAT